MRKATIIRKTNETNITVNLTLDGSGISKIRTGIGFFDHMLDQLSNHSLVDIEVVADGDLQIDDHHTVEDVGISLGAALNKSLGNKLGIKRYGSCLLPMDDALIRVALDLSGRPHLAWNVAFSASKIGHFDTELVQEFFNSFCMNGKFTLHVEMLAGINSHHICEATFKSVAQALRMALETDPRRKKEVPSTKGLLSK